MADENWLPFGFNMAFHRNFFSYYVYFTIKDKLIFFQLDKKFPTLQEFRLEGINVMYIKLF